MEKQIYTAAIAVLFGLSLSQVAVANESAEVFKQLDADGNGSLTMAEVAANPELVPDLEDNFEDGDANNDGMLDMAEFEKMDVVDE